MGLSPARGTALAVLGISSGFVFRWAFLDKTFGWSYATPSARAWINGGSPAKGFLPSVEVGPSWMQTFFHNIAGNPVTDWLFMLALLGIGLAFILGIGMLDKAGAKGAPSSSTNPITDYHFIYAITGIGSGPHLRRAHLGPRRMVGLPAPRTEEPLAHLKRSKPGQCLLGRPTTTGRVPHLPTGGPAS